MRDLLNSSLPSFAEKVIKAAKGEKGIIEPTFVYLPGVTGGDAIAKEARVDYFSVPVELGVRLLDFIPQCCILTILALWSGEGHKRPAGCRRWREEASRGLPSRVERQH